MTTPILRTSNLCKDFRAGGLFAGSTRAVDQVDLEVLPGETRGIVGESGSGKTTLARCSLRLLEPSSGRTYFDGEDLTAMSSSKLRHRRREFQMVFQDPFASLNPGMTIEDILSEPLQVHRIGDPGEQHKRLLDLMEAVSLDGSLLHRKPAELSGGQQQRIGIARGLALKPRLLVADEPVSALDVSVQAQILNLLSDLKKRYGLTLMLISHSLYVIHYLCTHVSVMYRGRIVEEAPSAGFFARPKHPYSRLLLESMPGRETLPDSAVRSLRENSESDPGDYARCVYYPLCPQKLDVCRERIPPLKEIAPGEKAACFLY
jgi:oligopeptide/dipeptide ABC transporter ATP-binding protein